jgi:hypothetical protein
MAADRRHLGPSRQVPTWLAAGKEDHVLDRFAEIVADRVAERLAPLLSASTVGQPEGLVDAHEIARRTGRSRWWVYEHAGELGAVRLGAGSRPRLGFWPARVEAYLKTAADLRAPVPQPSRARPKRRHPASDSGAELLQFARRDGRPAARVPAIGCE